MISLSEKRFTPGERQYLKEYNKRVQKFIGMPRADTMMKREVEEKTKKSSKQSNTESVQQVFSPLTQNSNSEIPLRNSKNRNSAGSEQQTPHSAGNPEDEDDENPQ